MKSISGWLPKPTKTIVVVVRSRVYDLPLHWAENIGRHARCFGAACALCSVYNVKSHACVVVSHTQTRGLHLLELTQAHEDLREKLENLGEQLVGTEIIVRPDTLDETEPLALAIGDWRMCKALDFRRYVAAIGCKEHYFSLEKLQLSL